MEQGEVIRDPDVQRQARRLQELFHGRFTKDEALQLLSEHGTVSDAVDFVLKGDPAEVRKFINTRSENLAAMRRDSEQVERRLTEGVASTIRLFACESCDRFWWRRAPARKEVSKCKMCKKKYDPVPREEEWGLAEFCCECGNTFMGAGWMSHTRSPCYACGAAEVWPSRILPPNRKRPHSQKQRTSHSCAAPNCYNQAEADVRASYNRPQRHQGSGYYAHDQPMAGGEHYGYHPIAGGQYYPRDQPAARAPPASHGPEQHVHSDADQCAHERSDRPKKVLYGSAVHVSTGSTVATFLSQGELAETYSINSNHLPSIAGSD